MKKEGMQFGKKIEKSNQHFNRGRIERGLCILAVCARSLR